MPDQSGFLPGLFELEKGQFGESEEEIAVKASIKAINEKKPLEPSQVAIAQTCISLARSIYLGNVKGRAIANEAAQLVAMLQLLAADDDTPDASELPAEYQEIFRVFATAPANARATASDDPAELR